LINDVNEMRRPESLPESLKHSVISPLAIIITTLDTGLLTIANGTSRRDRKLKRLIMAANKDIMDIAALSAKLKAWSKHRVPK